MFFGLNLTGSYHLYPTAQNESLKVLKLGWNNIRLGGAASIISNLKENVSLKEIDLCWNGIESRNCIEIGNVLISNNTLLGRDLIDDFFLYFL